MRRFSILAEQYHVGVIADYSSYLDSNYTNIPYLVAYDSIKGFTSDVDQRKLLRAVVNKVYGV